MPFIRFVRDENSRKVAVLLGREKVKKQVIFFRNGFRSCDAHLEEVSRGSFRKLKDSRVEDSSVAEERIFRLYLHNDLLVKTYDILFPPALIGALGYLYLNFRNLGYEKTGGLAIALLTIYIIYREVINRIFVSIRNLKKEYKCLTDVNLREHTDEIKKKEGLLSRIPMLRFGCIRSSLGIVLTAAVLLMFFQEWCGFVLPGFSESTASYSGER